MRTFYLISIATIVLLGFLHSLATFVIYSPFTIEAHWFMSAGLTLIFAGIANYINYQTRTPLSFRCALTINSLLTAFTISLVACAPKPTIIITTAISGLLLVNSVLDYRVDKKQTR